MDLIAIEKLARAPVRITGIECDLNTSDETVSIKTPLPEDELGRWLREVPLTAEGFLITPNGEDRYTVSFPGEGNPLNGMMRGMYLSHLLVGETPLTAYAHTIGYFSEKYLSPGQLRAIQRRAEAKIIGDYYPAIDCGDIPMVLSLFG